LARWIGRAAFSGTAKGARRHQGFQEADPEAVVAYYRVHFKPALARSEDYEKLMIRMQARFIEQGKAEILKSRAVEDRLVSETWASPSGYDLHPNLKGLNIRPHLAADTAK
jgi:hypothetical protein